MSIETEEAATRNPAGRPPFDPVDISKLEFWAQSFDQREQAFKTLRDEYALLLADEGARVVVNDLGGTRDGSGSSHAMADTVVDEIRQLGGGASANYDKVG